MKEYATLYDAMTKRWSIIAKDLDGNIKNWYVYLAEAGSEEIANDLADAMNAIERRI